MKQETNQLIRLDWVLHFMAKHAGQGLPQGDETWDKIRDKHPTLNISENNNENESYRKQIFDKLIRDKLITIDPADGRYWITLEGLIFKGYIFNEQYLKDQQDWKIQVERKIVDNGTALNRLTLLLAVGTIFLLLFEIYKFCFEHDFVFVCH